MRRNDVYLLAMPRLPLILSIGLIACKREPEVQPEQEVPSSLAAPDGAEQATPCPGDTEPSYIDVRREPVGIALDDKYLYWVDTGHFEEEPELHYVEDGAVWRVTRGGGVPTKLADGFGGTTSIWVEDGVVTVGTNDGLWRLEGDQKTRVGSTRDRVKLLHGSAFTTDGKIEEVWSGSRRIVPDAGYVEALAVSGNRIAFGGLRSGRELGPGLVGVVDGDRLRRISFPGRWVHSLAFDGDDLLVGGGRDLIRIPNTGTAWSIERVAPDDVWGLAVHDGVIFWIATKHGPRYSIRAARPGAPAVEIVEDEGAGWRFAVDDDALYWVTSAPVDNPWTRVPTPYRIARTPWRACLH